MNDIELTPLSLTDHARGPLEAAVTLIAYGDFECPYCRDAHVVLTELESRYAGRLRFVFRQFPLREIHLDAEPAAEAAEAAAAQGKFWEMYDALYGGERSLSGPDLRMYARDIGIADLARFDRELAEKSYQPVLDAAIEAAEQSGVDGTPMFFINGQPFEDEPTLEALSEAVQTELGAPAHPA